MITLGGNAELELVDLLLEQRAQVLAVAVPLAHADVDHALLGRDRRLEALAAERAPAVGRAEADAGEAAKIAAQAAIAQRMDNGSPYFGKAFAPPRDHAGAAVS